MEQLSLHISVNSVSLKRHKNCSYPFVHLLQVVPLEPITAICLFGIHRKRCNASLRRRAPKSNSPSYLLLSMMMLFWKYGISRHPFPWNTWTNAGVFNGPCILLTTSFLAVKNVAGLNVNQRKSYSSRKKHVPIALSGMSMGSGTVHQ